MLTPAPKAPNNRPKSGVLQGVSINTDVGDAPTPERFGPGVAGPHRVAPFEGVARSAAGGFISVTVTREEQCGPHDAKGQPVQQALVPGALPEHLRIELLTLPLDAAGQPAGQ